jgi:hypothetical protein
MLQNCRRGRNFKSLRPWQRFKRPEKASDGRLGCEFDYRAIVERHFGKHTGLRHSAKACPQQGAPVLETGRKTGGGEVQTY